MIKVALLKNAIGGKGGLEKVAKRFMEELLDQGATVTLLTSYSKKKPLPPLDPRLIVVPLCEDGPLSLLNLIRFDHAVQNWLKEHPQQIVFGFDRHSTQTHLRAGNGCHAAYLKLRKEGLLKRISFSINPLHRYILHLEKRGFENAEKIFTNSALVKNQILSHYQVAAEKIVVLHNNVEWDALEKPFKAWPEEQARLRKEWGIPDDHFVLLFAGHGYKRKGLPALLKALEGETKVTLLVVGRDKKQYIAPNARFFGPQESLIPFLQAADALCIPSLYDPFANVTVEALAMGLFVCSSRFNGGSEVLTPESGVVIDDLKEALKITFAHPKTIASSLAIRQSVQRLNYPQNLKTMGELTLAYAR